MPGFRKSSNASSGRRINASSSEIETMVDWSPVEKSCHSSSTSRTA
jgi:hypothetical protein